MLLDVGHRIRRHHHVEVPDIPVQSAAEDALFGHLPGANDPAATHPTEQIVHRRRVKDAVPDLGQELTITLGHNRFDEVWPFPIERVGDDGISIGGEVAIIVVGIDDVDIVTVIRTPYEIPERGYDAAHAGRKFLGVLVPVGIEHVYDQQGCVTHTARIPAVTTDYALIAFSRMLCFSSGHGLIARGAARYIRPMSLFDVSGKSILITGATGALGSVAARALSEAGALLTLTGANSDGLTELVESAGISDAALVTRRPETPDDAAAMVDAALARHGRLDGVLVASGMNKPGAIVDMAVEDFDAVMDANVRGAWLVCQAAGRVLLQQGDGGSVVLVSSVRGALGSDRGYTAYCASKAATDLLTKSLAAEWGRQQIRVNALAPTVFRSELTAWMYADDERGRAAREGVMSRIPLGRFAEPEDFVGALIYLLSDASSFFTGQVMYLDGGYTSC